MKPWSTEWRQAQLDKMKAEARNCRACELSHTRQNVVFGDGNPSASIMIIGEAPGEKEDGIGIPFVGRSGELLREMLKLTPIDENDVYITNVVMCRPPENRDPRRLEREACLNRLVNQIYLVDPLVIVAAGKVAFKALVGNRAVSIDSQHGKMHKCKLAGIKTDIFYDVFPMYHPSYIMRYDRRHRDGTWRAGGLAYTALEDLRGCLQIVNSMKTMIAIEQEQERRAR